MLPWTSLQPSSIWASGRRGAWPAEVHDAVRCLRGARLVSVEEHYSAPAHLPWVAIYRAGIAVPPVGEEWDDLRQRVAAAVREAVGQLWAAPDEAMSVLARA